MSFRRGQEVETRVESSGVDNYITSTLKTYYTLVCTYVCACIGARPSFNFHNKLELMGCN